MENLRPLTEKEIKNTKFIIDGKSLPLKDMIEDYRAIFRMGRVEDAQPITVPITFGHFSNGEWGIEDVYKEYCEKWYAEGYKENSFEDDRYINNVRVGDIRLNLFIYETALNECKLVIGENEINNDDIKTIRDIAIMTGAKHGEIVKRFDEQGYVCRYYNDISFEAEMIVEDAKDGEWINPLIDELNNKGVIGIEINITPPDWTDKKAVFKQLATLNRNKMADWSKLKHFTEGLVANDFIWIDNTSYEFSDFEVDDEDERIDNDDE